MLFCFSPDFFRVWIQDGAQFVKMRSSAKIRLHCRLLQCTIIKLIYPFCILVNNSTAFLKKQLVKRDNQYNVGVSFVTCFLSYRNVNLDIRMKQKKTPAYNVIGTITGREEPGTRISYLHSVRFTWQILNNYLTVNKSLRTITGHSGYVFEENSDRGITLASSS